MTTGPYHDEPDSASFSDELSLTDGYFYIMNIPKRGTRIRPARLMLQRQRHAKQKRRIQWAGLQGRRTRRTPPSSINPDETTPLIDASQPPTYFDATANPYQGCTMEQNEVSRGGVVGNESGLLIFTDRRSPQNMGDNPGVHPGYYGNTYYDRSRRRIRDCYSCSRFIKITLAICAVAVVV